MNVRVKAEVDKLDGLSAHADYREMLQCLQHSEGLAPRKCFLVLREEKAIDQFRRRINEQLSMSNYQ